MTLAIPPVPSASSQSPNRWPGFNRRGVEPKPRAPGDPVEVVLTGVGEDFGDEGLGVAFVGAALR